MSPPPARAIRTPAHVPPSRRREIAVTQAETAQISYVLDRSQTLTPSPVPKSQRLNRLEHAAAAATCTAEAEHSVVSDRANHRATGKSSRSPRSNRVTHEPSDLRDRHHRQRLLGAVTPDRPRSEHEWRRYLLARGCALARRSRRTGSDRHRPPICGSGLFPKRPQRRTVLGTGGRRTTPDARPTGKIAEASR